MAYVKIEYRVRLFVVCRRDIAIRTRRPVLDARGLDSSVPKINLGEIEALPRIVREKHVTELIVTDYKIDQTTLIALMDFCISEGLTVWFPPKLLPII